MSDFYVAVDGNDDNPGTEDRPFASLERARDAVRILDDNSGATVWLGAGTYRRTATFALTSADSGTEDAPVVYSAIPGQDVRISGGKRIPSSKFAHVKDKSILQRLDPNARDNVLQADVKDLELSFVDNADSVSRSRINGGMELFFNDRPMTLACWPNQGYALMGEILDSGTVVHESNDPPAPDEPPPESGGRFLFDDERINRWRLAADPWLHGYFCWDWDDEYVPAESIDADNKEIALARPTNYGLREGHRFRVINILEELDSPGEWFLDAANGILYFWPPDSLKDAHIVVSVMDEPLVSFEDVSNVTLRGLTLEAGRKSGVRINGGSGNLLESCMVRNMGRTGVDIGAGQEDVYVVRETKGGVLNGMRDCEIYNTGYRGVTVSGGNRKDLTPGNNFVDNCNIHHFGRIVKTYCSGVLLCGVGNRLLRSRIHDAPHTGVFFFGNEHVMEFNHAFDLCQETADAGAFYIGRDWSMRGNVIRHNFIHDIGKYNDVHHGFSGTMGIYLDDWASGTAIYGNVVKGVYIGLMIGSGNDNIVENNIWIDCSKVAIHVDARGTGWAKSYFDGRVNTLFDRLKRVNHLDSPYSERYPELVGILEGNPALPRGNRIDRNVSIAGKLLKLVDKLEPEFVGVTRNNIELETIEETGFVDSAGNDFRLKDDSPVFTKVPGFENILYNAAHTAAASRWTDHACSLASVPPNGRTID